MKKILALVLALTMALGVCTTAFAADNRVKSLTVGSDKLFTLDGKVMTPVNGNTLVPGTTYYYLLTNNEEAPQKPITRLSDLQNYRIGYRLEEGKQMIESVKLVIKSVDNLVDSGNPNFTSGKNAFLAITLKDNFILEEESVDGGISISGKNDAKFFTFAGDDVTGEQNGLPLSFVAMYPTEEDIGNGYYSGIANVMSFADDADDVILCFDQDVEVAGNMRGQKTVFVRMTDDNDKLADKYPDATLRLFEGNKDTFKREVTVTIPYSSADEDETPYLYEADANGALTKVKDVKYNAVDGAFVFKTKTLGNYVISDTALKSVTDPVDNSSSTSDTGSSSDNEQNPETGANDFVGLAAALAVVSVAGIMVARKK